MFTRLLGRVKGFDYSTHRRVICRVNVSDCQLSSQLAQSYSLCLEDIRAVQTEEGYELFCGKTAQKVFE
tara:strand:+ start:238 stop:444 length:207 start_codon:yes stop_codon:yes gene_type:complete